ncbi:unnamed protein product [Lampetra planeri]
MIFVMVTMIVMMTTAIVVMMTIVFIMTTIIAVIIAVITGRQRGTVGTDIRDRCVSTEQQQQQLWELTEGGTLW